MELDIDYINKQIEEAHKLIGSGSETEESILVLYAYISAYSSVLQHHIKKTIII